MEDPRFAEDIYLPKMLYALTVRSPVAKGRLISVECPKFPGSYHLITAKDIPGKNLLEDSNLPLFASQELSYIGEPVALLLGPDRNTLEEYAKNCKVIVDEEEPVFSMRKAGDGTDGESGESRVFAKRDVRIGDPEAAFADAVSVVRGLYRTGIQEHWYAEPTGAVAWTERQKSGDGEEDTGPGKKQKKLVICTATQWPYHVKRSVAGALGLPLSSVLVKPTLTGLHMDGKFWYPSLVSCHAALGAWITGKPVRLILTRVEDFAFSPKRCAAEIDIATAVDGKGTITGLKINASLNTGACGLNTAEILDRCCLGSLGSYNVKNILFSGAAYKTNIPPQGPFAGFGFAQGFFALERHVSYVADTCGQDPAGWRKENSIKNGILPLGFLIKDTVPQELLIDTVVKNSDYSRKWASYELLRQSRRQLQTVKRQRASPDSPAGVWAEREDGLRGIGIALGYQSGGLLYPGADRGVCSVELVLEKEGSLEIKTSMADGMAAGMAAGGLSGGSLWAGIAREILGVDEEKVRVNCGPLSPDSGPAVSSRGLTVVTKLVEQACLAIQKLRFRDPLPISVRKTARARRNPAWEERFPPPEGAPGGPAFRDISGFIRPGSAAAVVEVEIDPVEYIPRIRGVWMLVDGGRIISEDKARGKLKASAAQALGWAHREQIGYIDGRIPAEQYYGFDIFGPSEIPQINIDFIQNSPHPDGTYPDGTYPNGKESKGIGDLPFTCIPAAYLQAVSQATDCVFRSVPIRTPDIWEAGKRIPKDEV